MAKTVENFLSDKDKEAILEAIKTAEKNTSGEIRVHIESRCKGSELDRAAAVFKILGMHKTKLRNGVLIYLAFKDRKFAVIGDAGINKVVPENYWQDVIDLMSNYFIRRKFGKGIAAAILMIGEKLKEYFPYQDDDVNELPDDISFGR